MNFASSIAISVILGALSTAVAAPPAALAQADPCTARGPNFVSGNRLCLIARSFGAATSPHGSLFVVLHGDVSDGGAADYHFAIARSIAEDFPRAAVLAIVRPGYPDGTGLVSDGSANGRRDHYTAENIDAVADAIGNLKRLTQATRAVAVGHSGGAATAAVILGRHPGRLDAALLISCPCDLARWRTLNAARPWPMSLSPIQFVERVPPAARVVAAVGADDKNTWPILSQDYIAALGRRGAAATFVAIPGAGHSYDRAMANAVRRILAERFADL